MEQIMVEKSGLSGTDIERLQDLQLMDRIREDGDADS